MQSIKSALNAVYSAYAFALCFLLLLVTLVYLILFFWLPERLRLRSLYRLAYVLVLPWELLTGIFMRRIDAHKADPQKTYVVVSNHLNKLDVIVHATRLRHPVKPLVKQEFLRVPILGQILHLISVPVKRTDKASRQASLERMNKTLERGTSLIVFPEGTRNRTPEPLKPFFNGAFTAAIEAQVPILPTILLDTRSLQPVLTDRLYPGRCALKFLDPVPTEGLTLDDLESLKTAVWEQMYEFIVREDKFFRGRVPA